MKRSNNNRLWTGKKAILALAVMGAMGVAPSADAAILYWDANGAAADTGGTGTWGTANTWRLGSDVGGLQNWADNNDAVFAGTAGTVAVDANRIVGDFKVDTANYIFELSGDRSITLSSFSGSALSSTIFRPTSAANRVLTLSIGSGSTTYSGFLTDNATNSRVLTVTKSGNGKLILTGNNSYTGATNVTAGVLNVQNNTALGTAAGGVTVSANAALELEGGVAIGAEALSINGTGNSVQGALRSVSGSNSWAGVITNAANNSVIAADSGSTLTITGNILVHNNTGTRTLVFAGDGAIDVNTLLNTGSGSAAITYNGGSTGTLTLSGATSNTINAGTTVTGGLMLLNKTGSATAITGTLAIGTAATTPATVRYVGNSTNMIGTVAVNINGAGQLDFNGATDTIGNVTIVGTGAGGNTSAISNTAGGGTLTIGTLTITPDAASTISVNSGAGSLVLGGNVTFNAASAGRANITGNLNLGGATRTFTVADGSGADYDLAVDAIISNGGIIKAGAGTLRLNGLNTYTGTTTVNAGVLQLGISNALNSASTVSVAASGGTALLDLNGLNQTLTNVLTLSGSNATSAPSVTTGAGTLTVNGGVTYTATNNPLGGSISGLLSLGNATRTFTVGDSTTAIIDLAVSADISETAAAGLTKAGAGLLELSGTNSYTSGTTVSAGTLRFTNTASLPGSGNLNVAAGAAIELGFTSFARTIGAGSGQISVAATGRIGSSTTSNTTVTFNGGSTLTWGTEIPTGTWALSTGTSTGTTIVTNVVNLNATSRTIDVADGSAAIDADLTGGITSSGSNLTLTKAGAGTLRLGAALPSASVISTINLTGGLIVNDAGILAGRNLTLGGNAAITVDANQSADALTLNTGGSRTLAVTGTASNLLRFGTWNQGGGTDTTAVLNIANTGGVSVAGLQMDQRRNMTKSGSGLLEVRGTNIGTSGGGRYYTFALSDGGLAMGSDTGFAIVGTTTAGTGNSTTFLNLNGGTLASNSASTRDYRNTVYTTLGGNVAFGYRPDTSVPNASGFTGAQFLGAVAVNGGAVRTITANQDITFTSLTTGSGGGSIIKEGVAKLTLNGPGFITGSTPIEVNNGTLVVNGGKATEFSANSVGSNQEQVVFFASTVGMYVGQTVTYGAGLTAVVNQVFSNGIKLNQPNNLFPAIAGGTTFTFAGSAGGTGSLPVNVNNGGTLAGSGTVGGLISVASGGTVAPGTSPGILTADNGISFSGGSIYAWEHNAGNALGAAGTNFDQINVTGGSALINSTAGTGAKLQLAFDAATSFADAFWDTSRSWTIITGGITGGNLFDASNITYKVGAGSLSSDNTVSGEGFFTTTISGSDLILNWNLSGGTPAFDISPTTLSLSTLKGAAAVSGNLTLTNNGTLAGNTAVNSLAGPLSNTPTSFNNIGVGGTANTVVSLATGTYGTGSQNVNVTQNPGTVTSSTVSYNVGNAQVGPGNTFGTALTGTSTGADLSSITSNTEATAIGIDNGNSLSMDWRSPTALESQIVQGDIVRINTVDSDIYVLKLTYSSDANENQLFLGELVGGLWGSAGNELLFAKQFDFLYDQGALGLSDDLGRWGIVTTGTGGYVWAVVQGDGTFAAIPEPTSLALLGLGAAGLLLRRRKA